MEKRDNNKKVQASSANVAKQTNYNEIKQSYEKVQQQKKELSSLHKIDTSKLNINISV